MKVLVTGSNGFIGKHMCLLLNRKGYDVLKYDINDNEDTLTSYLSNADFIIHLAGVNRNEDKESFYKGNADLTKKICDILIQLNKNTPIIMSSSIRVDEDTDYAKSKRMGEDYLLSSGLPVYIYRLNNVFGKWCRPNYNSVCATFCYNIAHDLDIYIRDKDYVITFNYVEDVCLDFLRIIKEDNHLGSKDYLSVNPKYDCSLGRLADLLYYFKKEITSNRHLPLIHNEFELKLFKTFCDYFSDEGYSFNYSEDNRGSFEELFKSKRYGQISDNMAFPGITKGGHYHTYKEEVFETVIGEARITQRNIKNNDLIDVFVSGDNPALVNIIPYYTHQISNIGDINSHTIMWISEIYDEKTPDSFKEEVIK